MFLCLGLGKANLSFFDFVDLAELTDERVAENKVWSTEITTFEHIVS